MTSFSIPKLDYCDRCKKKKEYEDKQQNMDVQNTDLSVSVNET